MNYWELNLSFLFQNFIIFIVRLRKNILSSAPFPKLKCILWKVSICYYVENRERKLHHLIILNSFLAWYKYLNTQPFHANSSVFRQWSKTEQPKYLPHKEVWVFSEITTFGCKLWYILKCVCIFVHIFLCITPLILLEYTYFHLFLESQNCSFLFWTSNLQQRWLPNNASAFKY